MLIWFSMIMNLLVPELLCRRLMSLLIFKIRCGALPISLRITLRRLLVPNFLFLVPLT